VFAITALGVEELAVFAIGFKMSMVMRGVAMWRGSVHCCSPGIGTKSCCKMEEGGEAFSEGFHPSRPDRFFLLALSSSRQARIDICS